MTIESAIREWITDYNKGLFEVKVYSCPIPIQDITDKHLRLLESYSMPNGVYYTIIQLEIKRRGL